MLLLMRNSCEIHVLQYLFCNICFVIFVLQYLFCNICFAAPQWDVRRLSIPQWRCCSWSFVRREKRENESLQPFSNTWQYLSHFCIIIIVLCCTYLERQLSALSGFVYVTMRHYWSVAVTPTLLVHSAHADCHRVTTVTQDRCHRINATESTSHNWCS